MVKLPGPSKVKYGLSKVKQLKELAGLIGLFATSVPKKYRGILAIVVFGLFVVLLSIDVCSGVVGSK